MTSEERRRNVFGKERREPGGGREGGRMNKSSEGLFPSLDLVFVVPMFPFDLLSPQNIANARKHF